MSNGLEKYDRLMSVTPILRRYNTFMDAKNLGIAYGPSDMTYSDLKFFSFITQITPRKESNGQG